MRTAGVGTRISNTEKVDRKKCTGRENAVLCLFKIRRAITAERLQILPLSWGETFTINEYMTKVFLT